jgi:hypothetical protein
MVMGGRWRVDDVGERVWLVQRTWDRADPLPDGEPLAADAAAARLGAWFPEGWGSSDAQLASIALSLEGDFPGSAPPDPGFLKRTIRQALRDGRLVALRMPLPPPPGAPGGEDDEQPAAQPAPREEKTWIEIALVDDDDPPKPVPFKRYRIELPDSSAREGMLDANGHATLVGIDPGTCHVTFPDFDDRDWRPL